MRERPILFSGLMVQAILAGTKTQTRRVWKLPKTCAWYEPLGGERDGWWRDEPGKGCWQVGEAASPYGRADDRLWVKETFFAWGRWETRFSAKKGRDEWHFIDMTRESEKAYLYTADGFSDTQAFSKRRDDRYPMYWKRPAIFMPRHVSRITLEITGVRVERLESITTADAIAEGTPGGHGSIPGYNYSATPYEHYRWLWESINGAGSWAVNPWVWVVEFRRIAQEA